MLKHSQKCQREQAAFSRDMRAYERKYPNHCEDCNGAGGKAFPYDPSPSGVSLSAGVMWEWEPCESCIAKGRCPRCFKHVFPDELLDHDHLKCPLCGWKDGDSGPFMPECWCEYEGADHLATNPTNAYVEKGLKGDTVLIAIWLTAFIVVVWFIAAFLRTLALLYFPF